MSNRIHEDGIPCEFCRKYQAERLWHRMKLCTECWISKQDDEEDVYRV